MALFKVKAVPDFTQLRSELTKLSTTPVKIKVDATEFTQLSNQAIKTMNATARLTKAQNELAVAQEKTKQTANQLAAAQQKSAQTANQLATQMEKTATAEEKARKANLDLSREIQKATTEQEKQKTAAAQAALQQEKAATASANLAVQQEKTATASAKAAGNIAKVGKSAKETSGFADLMGDSLGRTIGKMAAWQVLGAAISAVGRAFTDALETMKSVDDEMVTIRKVTGATTEDLQKLETQAYKTASAYGVAADEYLSSVAAFSRAGYGDQAAALAELATKTQIVGDTDAETAQQFLLSVDAAYKYKGGIEQLTRVLDGANEIDNKYATSIEKIAEGLGKVAPIASQAHVGVDELTAAIGTITAVTQRSGTEAATALRALFLNIIGDTKTEIDEGVTWTTGEIAGLRDVIKVYAKDAYEAAEATGSVINPMEAIAGLAQSMKDKLLTEQQLMEMVSDIGGKLRTSQLLALIQNWDMYQSMLGDYANSIGSADKEVENALDSWSRKTEILKNKWTEFVSHLVETDGIKGALDGVIGLVELLDSDTGRFIITVAALTAGVGALGQGLKWLGGTELIKNGKALAECFVEAASGAGSFSSVLGLMNPKILIAVAAVAALYGAYKLLSGYIEEANRSLASYDEEIDGVNSQLENNKKRIEEINNLPWEQRTSAILDEKKALEEENKELERQIELLNKDKLERARNVVKESVGTGEMTTVSHGGTTSRRTSSTFEKTVAGAEAYSYLTEQLNEYSDALDRNGEISDDIRAKYEENVAASARMVEALKTMQAAGDDLTDEQLALIAAYDNFVSASDNAQNAIKNHVSALIDEQAQMGATGQALYDLVAAQIAASNTGLNFTQQMAALQELALQAGYTMDAINAVFAASGNVAKWQLDRWDEQTIKGLMRLEGMSRADAEAEVIRRKWGSLTTTYTPSTSTKFPSYSPSSTTPSNRGSTSSSASSNAAARKNAQAAIKQLQKERDAELDVIQEQIDALQEQADIEDRQAKIEEYKLNILKKQDALLNARNERTVRQYNAATGQWEWVADEAKVKKAEEDLEDAKKDLRDYERKVELDIAVDELKARQEAIKAAYQIKIDAWNDYLSGLSNAISTESGYLNQSVENNINAANKVIKAWEAANAAKDNSKNNNNPGTGNVGDYGYQDRNQWIQDRVNQGDTRTEAQRSWSSLYILPGGTRPSSYNNMGINSLVIAGIQTWYGANNDGKWGGKSYDKAGGRDAKRAYDLYANFRSKYDTYKKFVDATGYYDEGGILQGMGGIKATPRDEVVLPPKLAARMLTPQASQIFKSRVSELGYVYGAEAGMPKSLTGSSADNRSYTDHSGAEYHVENITLTEGQAANMTVRELCRMAHHLQIYGN